MNICVLSGSPKGQNSITYQTILYLEKKYKDIKFDTLHIGSKINYYQNKLDEALEVINKADVILFCYPVYTFIVPSQLQTFIELLLDNNISLKDKYALQISTSKHFFDITAHEYIKEISFDLNLKYVGGLSLDMEDLLDANSRKDILSFFDMSLFKIKNDYYEKPINYHHNNLIYNPTLENKQKDNSFKTIIVADLKDDDENLKNMIIDFQSHFPYKSEVLNINSRNIKGGCLGCLNCAATGKCIYNDHFDEVINNEINNKDAIIYAFTLKGHSMGARFKMYDDRQFCNGHRTLNIGKPLGYIVNGDLSDKKNLTTILKARADVGQNYLAGIATNKEEIKELINTLDFSLKNKTKLPQTFYGVGGTKIFRDLIYLMQGMMPLDYKFFKENNMLDFPQNHKDTILKMKLVGKLMSNQKLKMKMNSKINEGMLAPYKKVLEED